ncbi:hypothetical protein GGX14DRAFT_469452, partial [Mycena pura]
MHFCCTLPNFWVAAKSASTAFRDTRHHLLWPLSHILLLQVAPALYIYNINPHLDMSDAPLCLESSYWRLGSSSWQIFSQIVPLLHTLTMTTVLRRTRIFSQTRRGPILPELANSVKQKELL